MEDLRFPVGKYEPQPYSLEQRDEWLKEIKNLPANLENSILNLDVAQLETPYRPEGWTVKEVVNHVADSHMNALIRFKLALTEDNPAIKPYKQDQWVKLDDVKELPINYSITLLHAVHAKWYALIRHFGETEWDRTLYHPEQHRELTLWHMLGLYAWHSRHHVAHITSLRNRMNW